jgi:hypothetical protein
VLAIRGAGEMLAYQPRHEQECRPGSVVGHDALCLPGGVAHDQDDVAERLAADPGRVVLEEAVFAVGPAKLNCWRS